MAEVSTPNRDLLAARHYEDMAKELEAEMNCDLSNVSQDDFDRITEISEEIIHEREVAYKRAAEHYLKAAGKEPENRDLWERAGARAFDDIDIRVARAVLFSCQGLALQFSLRGLCSTFSQLK